MFPILKVGALAILFSVNSYSPAEMRMLVADNLKNNPGKNEIMRVIECESGFDHLIQSQHPDLKGPNGKENSWGLVQINLDWNPEVKLEEALSWRFSLEFIKNQFAAGKQKLWTCWR